MMPMVLVEADQVETLPEVEALGVLAAMARVVLAVADQGAEVLVMEVLEAAIQMDARPTLTPDVVAQMDKALLMVVPLSMTMT